MSIYLELAFMALVLVFIIDLSGFTDTFLAFSSRIVGKPLSSLRPFTCSLCMVFWTGLLLALIHHRLNLCVAVYVCGLAYFSKTLSEVFPLIREGLSKLIGKIADLLKL